MGRLPSSFVLPRARPERGSGLALVSIAPQKPRLFVLLVITSQLSLIQWRFKVGFGLEAPSVGTHSLMF